jgi:hypothetical protein
MTDVTKLGIHSDGTIARHLMLLEGMKRPKLLQKWTHVLFNLSPIAIVDIQSLNKDLTLQGRDMSLMRRLWLLAVTLATALLAFGGFGIVELARRTYKGKERR